MMLTAVPAMAQGPATPGAEGQQRQLEAPELGPPEMSPSPSPLTEQESEWEGKSVVDVAVQGNRRVETDTVLERIETEPGDTIDREQISTDIRRVYDLGYFRDIRVEGEVVGEDQVLITFVIEEMPAIDSIEFSGVDELSEDDVEDVITIRRFAILNISQVNASAEAIRELYHDEGFFLAEVDFDISEVDGRPDLARVTFNVQEYAQVEVKRVTFLGNEAVSDEELGSIMATRPGNFLSFLTDMGAFREDAFEEDLQRMTAYYYDQGHVQVQVQMPTIRLSADKQHLYITIRVEEGPLHHAGSMDVQGDLLTDREDLLDMISLAEGDVFRYGRMQEDMMRISRFYQDAGYANVQVNPLTRIDPETNIVDVAFDINQGQKVRIGRIEVTGNATTRDAVIRRELAIEEGDWYSASAVERSEMRVRRLGFFEEVNVTSQRTNQPDIIDLQIQVAERPTGTFQLGAGLSSQENFIFQGQVAQQNLFGRGQSLELSAQASSIRTLFNLRFSEPWLLGSRWNMAIDLYNFDFLYQDFARRSMGGTLTFGYPIGELLGLPMGDALRTSVRYKLEDVDVRPGGITGSQAQPGSPLFQGGLTSSLRLGTTYDTRDDQLFPTSGAYHSASVELADETWTLSGNEFVKFDGDVRTYVPLFWNFVLRLNASSGLVLSTAEDQPVPIFERYFVGGPETVRGFERFTLGPSQRVAGTQDDPAGGLQEFRRGGNKKLVFTAEVEFPIFAAAQLRGVFFADTGNAFDDGVPFNLRPDIFVDDEDMYVDALRTSVGFGIRWFSPIGPLRFEWGFPLQRLRGERPVVFDFSITNAF